MFGLCEGEKKKEFWAGFEEVGSVSSCPGGKPLKVYLSLAPIEVVVSLNTCTFLSGPVSDKQVCKDL
jgi:hypothetical protein